MSILSVSLQGRFGNQTLQWLFAYAFAKKHGMDFRCPEWIGERVFDLPKYERLTEPAFQTLNEHQLFDAIPVLTCGAQWKPVEFRGYAQMQKCASLYTKREAQAWLKLRPEIEAGGRESNYAHIPIIGHRRAGDYAGYGYPVVAIGSYIKACRDYGLDEEAMLVLSEERAQSETHLGLPPDLAFVADFYRMMKAPTLLRGNSSFSFLAGLLGNGLVLSPVVDGLEGGKEHVCKFVAGNHPKFTSHLDFVEDLHVSDI